MGYLAMLRDHLFYRGGSHLDFLINSRSINAERALDPFTSTSQQGNGEGGTLPHYLVDFKGPNFLNCLQVYSEVRQVK